MEVLRKALSSSFYTATVSLLFSVLTVSMKGSASARMTNGTNITNPGCSSKCGNMAVPYPFGIGDVSCSLNPSYHVICNTSYEPPRPFLMGEDDERFEILYISETQLHVRNRVAFECYDSSGKNITDYYDSFFFWGFLSGSPFSFSSESNMLTTTGCSTLGSVYSVTRVNNADVGSTNDCNSYCPSKQKVVGGRCEGVGCCQVRIAEGTQKVEVYVSSKDNKTASWSYNHCSYAFLAEKDTCNFGGISDLIDPDFVSNTIDNVPILIDWVIGNETCEEAQKETSTSYACQANTRCSSNPVRVMGGYTCHCLEGFRGNPYLWPGCSDIDECARVNSCSDICHNQPGNYSCSCPLGYDGDGRKDGTGCTKKGSQLFILKLALGISLGSFCLGLFAIWMYMICKKVKRGKLKEKCFRENGGLLLQELLLSFSLADRVKLKIFTQEELKVATKNFSQNQVLGKGGHGIVYKGVLSDNQVVAIKKTKVVDQSQIEEFINEIVILAQIDHVHVVKIVGCCLEIEVPMLVYEYISNGTLFDHIHSDNKGQSWLDWSNRMRIAIEAAGALAHLHSAISIPVIHRDVKSSNILIDESYAAKISDFGASRLIPLDQSSLSTVVQGTLGYLDPEYFHSGHLTEKSDVYSFGIVLIELLTGQKPISEERDVTERSLSTCFVKSFQPGKMLHILDPRMVEEAPAEQLLSVVELAANASCLEVKTGQQ